VLISKAWRLQLALVLSLGIGIGKKFFVTFARNVIERIEEKRCTNIFRSSKNPR
jgi:hypothetical protein